MAHIPSPYTYSTPACERPARADSAHGAASIFARRLFGRRGHCRSIRHDSSARDGSVAIYRAFVGVPVRGGNTEGRNIWIYATRNTQSGE